MKAVRGGARITGSSSVSSGKYVRDAIMEKNIGMNIGMGMLGLETFPWRSEYPCISQGSPERINRERESVCVYIYLSIEREGNFKELAHVITETGKSKICRSHRRLQTELILQLKFEDSYLLKFHLV